MVPEGFSPFARADRIRFVQQGATTAMSDLIERACKLEDAVTATAEPRCMALNGRPNRRLICVSLSSGKEIGVFE